MSFKSTLIRTSATLSGAAFIAGGLALATSPAMASSIQNDDNVAIADFQSTYANGDTISVTQDDLTPNADYRVGVCEYTAYDTTIGGETFKMPACSAGSQETVTADSNGTVSFTVDLLAEDANAHSAFQGQPKTVNFTDKDAEVIVTEHSNGGVQVGDSKSFRVN